MVPFNFVRDTSGITHTLDDVLPIVQKAVENGKWQPTGRPIISAWDKTFVGDGLILHETVDGQTIWVQGIKRQDGTIWVTNAGVD